MKFALPLVVFAAVASATPIAQPAADADAQWCPLKGQSCWKKVKRAAEPGPEADAQWCPLKGQSCWKKVKREAVPEAEAVAEADAQWCPLKGQSCWKMVKRAAEPGPEAEAQWCPLKGQSCWKKVKREAAPEAQPAAEAEAQWCPLKGQSCWKVKRAAEAFSTALQSMGGLPPRDESGHIPAQVAKRQIDELASIIALSQRDPNAYYYSLALQDKFAPSTDEEQEAETVAKREAQWCPLKGQSCWKKREAEAQWCPLKGQSCWKRDAAPEAQWCPLKGQSCWKAKRAAEAVVTAIEAAEAESALLLRDRTFNPVDRVGKRDPQFCNIKFTGPKPGGCWKRDASPEAACNAPDGACTKATRDLHAMYNAARAIINAHSEAEN